MDRKYGICTEKLKAKLTRIVNEPYRDLMELDRVLKQEWKSVRASYTSPD